MNAKVSQQPAIVPQQSVAFDKDEKKPQGQPAVDTSAQPAVTSQPKREHQPASRLGAQLRAALQKGASKAGAAIVKSLEPEAKRIMGQAQVLAKELSQSESLTERLAGTFVKSLLDMAKEIGTEFAFGDAAKREEIKEKVARNPEIGKQKIGKVTLDEEMALFPDGPGPVGFQS
jgi:hypothetical protein